MWVMARLCPSPSSITDTQARAHITLLVIADVALLHVVRVGGDPRSVDLATLPIIGVRDRLHVRDQPVRAGCSRALLPTTR